MRQLEHCKSRRMVDPSCLQLSNRVPYWLTRIPRELWKSIRLWLDRRCPPRLRVCVSPPRRRASCTCVARRVPGPGMSFPLGEWKYVSASSARWLACVEWGGFLSNESVSPPLMSLLPVVSEQGHLLYWFYFERTRTISSCQMKSFKAAAGRFGIFVVDLKISIALLFDRLG